MGIKNKTLIYCKLYTIAIHNDPHSNHFIFLGMVSRYIMFTSCYK